MPIGLPQYIMPNVRVRAMVGKMLDDETWMRLDSSRDVPGMLAILAKTAYAPVVAQLEEACPPCELLEAKLNGDLASSFAHVIDLTPRTERPLVVVIEQLFEVDNLKTLLRGIEMGESTQKMKSFMFPTGRNSTLNYDELLRAESVADLIPRLQSTPYGEALRRAQDRYEEEGSLFPLETALDLGYYRRLWQALLSLGDESRKRAKRLIGTWYDVINVVWALRYHYYHRLSLAEIMNYTLPYGYRVNDGIIRAIAEGQAVGTVLKQIWGSDAPDVNVYEDGWLPRLETELHRYLVELAHGALVGYPFHLGVVLAYLILKRYEVQDLMVLVEAKMSSLHPAEYRGYMVHQFR